MMNRVNPIKQINAFDDLYFSELVVEKLLKKRLSITESVIHNISCLQQHWNNVEFELKFEITERCNLNCTFCHQEFGKKESHGKDFSLEIFKNIIDAAKKEKQIKYIRITGGEPLLHPDVKDFLQYAAEAGFCTILNTNATLLTAEKISSFAPFVGIWKISLPSLGEYETDFITGYTGAWYKKINTLRLLQANNCKVDLLVVLAKGNIPHISDFLDIAKKYDATCSFLRQESNATEQTPLTKKDVEDIVVQLELNNSQLGLAVPFCACPEPERLATVADGRIGCGPYSSLVVSKNGKVHSCYSRRKLYEVDGSILKTAMRIAADDFAALPEKCQKCRFGAICLGGCRCNMTLVNSTIGSIDYLATLKNISNITTSKETHNEQTRNH